MILGNITGKITTTNFKFKVDRDTSKFDYIQVYHKNYGYVLGQVIELVSEKNNTIALCNIIGYLDKEKKTKQMRVLFESKAEVLKAEDSFIKDILRLESNKKGAYIGMLDGKKIEIRLDLNKLLTKHVSIIAKTGAGKSYIASVLIEEILDKKVPLLIIDPHGEYSALREKNDNKKDIKRMQSFGITAKAYSSHIREYGDINILNNVRPLKLNQNLTSQELIHFMPGKLTSNQQGVLYSALKNVKHITIKGLLDTLELEENNVKWHLINAIDHIEQFDIFSQDYTQYNELIQPGKCSIINLKGIEPEVQEIIVYKLLKDLFEERKKSSIPPFFAVIEEAHNFCPERGFGEAKSAKIIRTIAGEGRKFGLGLCVISQRPARVEKSVLSQCNTQIILKVTNPNDLKAIISSVEGITSETESNIKSLPIGTAMITGIVDMPLFVNTRPKKSKHGGEAIDIFAEEDETIDILKETKKFAAKDILPVIKAKTTLKDLILMSDKPIQNIITYLIPAAIITCKDKQSNFNLLFDMIKGDIITDIAQSILIPFGKAKTNLKEHETFESIEYKSIGYDKKIKPKINQKKLKGELEPEIEVIEIKECFIVHHKIEYK
ncbi:MAG: ATP-binding protein [Nanoarchaeota archaeon]|nr:ATP-binding protein [Nanoarchaeota archaeon]